MATGLTHHPHAASGDDLSAEAHAIVRTGKALLNCGAETYRVRQSMGEVAAAIGIQWLQSQVSLSELTVTLFKGPVFRTQVGNVHSVGVNGDKMSELERMTADLPARTTPADVEARLDAIDHKEKLYAPALQALVAAIACAAVAFLNNAWALEVAAVLVAAFVGQLAKALLLARRVNIYLTNLAAAFVAAFIYLGVTAIPGWVAHSTYDYAAGIVPALIFLVPGFPLVNALLDLIKTDMTAGLSRLAYAFMILASAATALMAATWVGGGSPEPLAPAPLPGWLWWTLAVVASGVGVAGWAIMFNVTWRGALLAGATGLIGNTARLVLLNLAHAPSWVSAMVGCLVIGILAAWFARRVRQASVALVVPAALIMVPGAPAFRALVYFWRGDFTPMMTNASLAIFTIVGMGIGLSIARILSDKEWIFDKRRALGD